MLILTDMETFREKLLKLVGKFDKDKSHNLSKGYPEAQVRLDFLNPLFEALGWDIENKGHKPPHERDVIDVFSRKANFTLNCGEKT